MKRWGILLPIMFLALTSALQAQFTNPCAGEKGIASVPREVRRAFGAASSIPNRQESIKKELEIARKPGSGLSILYALISEGKFTNYMIVVASAPKCVVALMPFDPGPAAAHRPNVHY